MRSLLAVRPQTGPRSLPGLAVAWLGNPSRTVAMPFIGERTTRSSRWALLRLLLLSVDVVQTVHAELVVVSADVEVETEGCEGGDTILSQYVTSRGTGMLELQTYSPRKAKAKSAL